jgi:uncharacterized protein YcgI (DUF1989 family)
MPRLYLAEETTVIELNTIPARRGKSLRIGAGKTVKIVNTYGQQVIDTWAFNAEDRHEFMSMEHSRARLQKVNPKVGDSLFTNRRRPILTLMEDTTAGIHDTLIAACDRYRYELLGAVGYHDNCTDNLANVLKEIGWEGLGTPGPLNLFMNVGIDAGGKLQFMAPTSRPGQYVSLRAEMEAIIVFSACPQDLVPVNGDSLTPTDAHFFIEN